ncbi:MAG: cobalamin-binding protein [Betaproteobacteria bacterium]
MKPTISTWFAASLAVLATCSGRAEVIAVDDSGATVVLKATAKRIISLAPHTTELLFAAGAGDRIVGTMEYSDYPAAAKSIPRIGSSSLLDMERIITLKPDLIVVWLHGSSASHLEKLRTLGVPIFQNEPRTLADIPRALMQLGTLAGTEDQARPVADAFSSRVAMLRARYAGRPSVGLFWQVWARPLLTINGRHLIDGVIRLCGGTNIFERLSPLVPAVSIEAVVQADPEAIVTTSHDASAGRDDGLDVWRRFSGLRATSHHNLIVLDADMIHRSSPRILDGAAALCEQLEDVRIRRSP